MIDYIILFVSQCLQQLSNSKLQRLSTNASQTSVVRGGGGVAAYMISATDILSTRWTLLKIHIFNDVTCRSR